MNPKVTSDKNTLKSIEINLEQAFPGYKSYTKKIVSFLLNDPDNLKSLLFLLKELLSVNLLNKKELTRIQSFIATAILNIKKLEAGSKKEYEYQKNLIILLDRANSSLEEVKQLEIFELIRIFFSKDKVIREFLEPVMNIFDALSENKAKKNTYIERKEQFFQKINFRDKTNIDVLFKVAITAITGEHNKAIVQQFIIILNSLVKELPAKNQSKFAQSILSVETEVILENIFTKFIKAQDKIPSKLALDSVRDKLASLKDVLDPLALDPIFFIIGTIFGLKLNVNGELSVEQESLKLDPYIKCQLYFKKNASILLDLANVIIFIVETNKNISLLKSADKANFNSDIGFQENINKLLDNFLSLFNIILLVIKIVYHIIFDRKNIAKALKPAIDAAFNILAIFGGNEVSEANISLLVVKRREQFFNVINELVWDRKNTKKINELINIIFEISSMQVNAKQAAEVAKDPIVLLAYLKNMVSVIYSSSMKLSIIQQLLLIVTALEPLVKDKATKDKLHLVLNFINDNLKPKANKGVYTAYQKAKNRPSYQTRVVSQSMQQDYPKPPVTTMYDNYKQGLNLAKQALVFEIVGMPDLAP